MVRMMGILSIKPTTGTRDRNAIVAGINPRNNSKNPYDSSIMPMIGQPNKTIIMPEKNDVDAFHLWR